MGLRARVLKYLETGPRKKNVLRGLVRTPRQAATFDAVLDELRAAGAIVLRGSKRGTTYGLRGWRA